MVAPSLPTERTNKFVIEISELMWHQGRKYGGSSEDHYLKEKAPGPTAQSKSKTDLARETSLPTIITPRRSALLSVALCDTRLASMKHPLRIEHALQSCLI